MVGDEVYFYCSGRGNGNVTSLAVLRRKAFVSLDACDNAGTVTTRPVTFRGKHLFVNVDCSAGLLQAEVVDRDGNAIAPFTKDKCKPLCMDRTLQRVEWQSVRVQGAGRAPQYRNEPLLTNVLEKEVLASEKTPAG